MTIRVLLVAPAGSRALREARFAGGAADGAHGDGQDDDLDAAGLRQARAARPYAAELCPPSALVYASASRRCVRTAELLGLDAEPLPGLGPCAMGRWQGRALDEVAAAEPQSVATWLADPAAAPHGGESLLELLARAGHWLDTLAESPAGLPVRAAPAGAGGTAAPAGEQRPGSGRVVVVAEPDIIRAAAVHALGAGPGTFWRIDVRPLSVTELSGRNGRWNMLGGRPLPTGPGK